MREPGAGSTDGRVEGLVFEAAKLIRGFARLRLFRCCDG